MIVGAVLLIIVVVVTGIPADAGASVSSAVLCLRLVSSGIISVASQPLLLESIPSVVISGVVLFILSVGRGIVLSLIHI